MTGKTMIGLAVTVLGKKAELIERPLPGAGENGVVVKTHYSGVSIGTEMWIATGRRKDYGEVPFVNGYQAAGEVVEVGGNVEGVKAGDIVVVFCSGSHSQYVRADKEYVHVLPKPAAELDCSLFVMPCVGMNALNHANVNAGETVLVTGQGLIGQCTALLARLRGAYVIASEKSAERIGIARKYCADWVVDAGEGRVSSQVLKRFPDGVDVVIESTGFQEIIDDAMMCVRGNYLRPCGGRFVFEGFYPDTVTYNFDIPHNRQIHAFYPCFIGPRSNQQGAVRLIASGLFNMRPLISHVVPWRESEAVYNKLLTPERNNMNGIVIDWTR